MSKRLGVGEWCAFALIAAVAGGLVASWSGWKIATAAENWWDIAGAGATFFAALVALALGWVPLKAKFEEDRRRANIVGWLLVPLLGTVAAGARSMEKMLGEMIEQVDKGVVQIPIHQFGFALKMMEIDERHLRYVAELHLLGSQGESIAEVLSTAGRLHENLHLMPLDPKPGPWQKQMTTLRKEAATVRDLCWSLIVDFGPDAERRAASAAAEARKVADKNDAG